MIQNVAGVSWARVQLGTVVMVEATPITPAYWQVVYDPEIPDISISRWQLIRTEDFDRTGAPVLTDQWGELIPHLVIETTTNINEPIPDPMDDPCDLG